MRNLIGSVVVGVSLFAGVATAEVFVQVHVPVPVPVVHVVAPAPAVVVYQPVQTTTYVRTGNNGKNNGKNKGNNGKHRR